MALLHNFVAVGDDDGGNANRNGRIGSQGYYYHNDDDSNNYNDDDDDDDDEMWKRMPSTDDATGARIAPQHNGKSACTLLLLAVVATLEVSVSKLFGSGFAWQLGAQVAAAHTPWRSGSLGMCLLTGAGDALGVFAFGLAYLLLKRAVMLLVCTGSRSRSSSDAGSGGGGGYDTHRFMFCRDVSVLLWLAAASFGSGASWQALRNLVDSWGAVHGEFTWLALLTGLACGVIFLVGLTLGRLVLARCGVASSSAPRNSARYSWHTQAPSWRHFADDAALSLLGIAAAEACFVSTDASRSNYLMEKIFLTDGSWLMNCVKAGLTTAMGFAAIRIGVQHPIEFVRNAWRQREI
jgi:hypothetical protein